MKGSHSVVSDPMDYTVYGLLQTGILDWVAISFSRGSFRPRDRTRVSCIASRCFTTDLLGIPASLTGPLPRSAQSHWPAHISARFCPRACVLLTVPSQSGYRTPAFRASQMALVVKNLPANAGDTGDMVWPLGQEIPWRKKWQPTPVFSPRKTLGQRGLAGYSPWSRKSRTRLRTEHTGTY